VVEPHAAPLTVAAEAEPAAASPVLRSHDGDTSHAPAFLQSRPEPRAEAEESEPRPKARRRRAPRSFEGSGEAEASPAPSADVAEEA